jgi:hypothetical protein
MGEDAFVVWDTSHDEKAMICSALCAGC